MEAEVAPYPSTRLLCAVQYCHSVWYHPPTRLLCAVRCCHITWSYPPSCLLCAGCIRCAFAMRRLVLSWAVPCKGAHGEGVWR
eukprot:1509314-Rhodomonas_salina.3